MSTNYDKNMSWETPKSKNHNIRNNFEVKTRYHQLPEQPAILADDDADSDVSTENFSTGEHVLLDGKIKAKVAYFGQVLFSHDDDWVGLELEESIGKHSGTVGATEYFKCKPLHGLFVRSHRLQRTDYMGHVTARVKSPYRLRPPTRSPAGSPDLEMEEDIFTKADKTDPLGFYEARAGTVRSPDLGTDDISSKFNRLINQLY